MQPQCLSSTDRDLFLKTGPKDGGKRGLGILKTRARSNSESGRGTMSSPEDSSVRHQSSLGESRVSGLSTPVVIDRKSSINSPVIANHVKNILSSLEGSVPTAQDSEQYPYDKENGGRVARGVGRRSLDEEKICLDDKHKRPLEINGVASARSATNKRRGSLQPQKHIDEDDEDNLPAYFNTSRRFTLATVHQDAPMVSSFASSSQRKPLLHNEMEAILPLLPKTSPASSLQIENSISDSKTDIGFAIDTLKNISNVPSEAMSSTTTVKTTQSALSRIDDTQNYNNCSVAVCYSSPTTLTSAIDSRNTAVPHMKQSHSPVPEEPPDTELEQEHNCSSVSTTTMYTTDSSITAYTEQSTMMSIDAPPSSALSFNEDDSQDKDLLLHPILPLSEVSHPSSISSTFPHSVVSSDPVLTTQTFISSNKNERPDGTLKPKTFRTPSDIENENNLIPQESNSDRNESCRPITTNTNINNKNGTGSIRHSSVCEETEGNDKHIEEQTINL